MSAPKIFNFTGAGVTSTRDGDEIEVHVPGVTEATLAEAQAGTGSTQLMTPRRVRDVTQRVFDVRAYGAKVDGQTAIAFIASGSTTLTALTSVFSPSDVGKVIEIPTAGASGAALVTTIAAYISPTQVTIATPTSSALTISAFYGNPRTQVIGKIVSGSLSTFTAVGSTPFVSGDTGKTMDLLYCGDSTGTTVLSSLITYVSSSQVTLTTAATIPTQVRIWWGTDDTEAIQDAILDAWANGGGRVVGPNGVSIIAGPIITSDNNGFNPKSQLYIPSDEYVSKSITLEGESESICSGYSFVTYNGWVLKSTVSYYGPFSGCNASVLGISPTTGEGDSLTQFFGKNITLMVSTNGGTEGPGLSGLNGLYSYPSGYKIMAGVDVALAFTVDPNTGPFSGGVNYHFGILWNKQAQPLHQINEMCTASGFNYGQVGCTEIMELINPSVFICKYAFVWLGASPYFVTGVTSAFGCKYHHYFPTVQLFGNSNPVGATPVSLFHTCEEVGYFRTGWYTFAGLINDANSYAYGELKYACTGVSEFHSDSTALNIHLIKRLMKRQASMSGDAVTNPGLGINDSGAVFEIKNSGVASPGDTDAISTLQLTQNQPSSSGYVGGWVVVNSALSSVKAVVYGFAKMIGATSTKFAEAALKAGTMTLTREFSAYDHRIYQVSYLGQFASDAAADASTQSGSADDGAEYYNTTAHKKKVKENGSWKTVTTS